MYERYIARREVRELESHTSDTQVHKGGKEKKKKDLEGLILNKNSRNKNLLFIPKKYFIDIMSLIQ